MTIKRTALVALAIAAMTFLACGDDESQSGAAGGEGPGGAGGSTSQGGSATGPGTRPTCNAGAPTGGTPMARADSAGALNQAGTELMVFGGDVATVVCGQGPVREHVADTWILDTACGEWTEVSGGPPARARHTASSDFARNQAVIFGGRTRTASSGPYDLFDDVWTFDFTSKTWAQVTATGTGPTARANAASAIVGDELFVFGGNSSPDALSFAPESDLFALNLVTSTWRQITSAGPSARLFHAMAADPTTGLIFVGMGGGVDAFVGPFYTDVWAFNPTNDTWTALQSILPAGAAEGRIKLGMSVRPASDLNPATLYVVAGHDDGALGNRNDILSLELPPGNDPSTWGSLAWSRPVIGDTFNNPATGQCDFPADFTNVDQNAFERRSAVTFTASPDGHAFVTFGGDSDCGRLNDAWWFNASSATLENIRPTLVGLTCPRTGNTNCNGLCG